jgi:hypothetical protein
MSSRQEDRTAVVGSRASDASIAEAARARARTRRLQEAATADATLTGVLVDLGERQVPVTVATADGRSLDGIIALVGTDVIGVTTANRGTALVPMRAIVTLTTSSSRPPSGPRPAARSVSFAALVTELAAARATVEVGYGHHRMTGRLAWCGSDVLAFGDAQGRARHVPLAQVSALLVLASG